MEHRLGDHSSSHRSTATVWLQNIVNVVVVLAGLSVVWAVWSRQGRSEPPSYTLGERLGDIDGVTFQDSDWTLVMAIRQDCSFCEDSLPFYRRLTTARRQGSHTANRVVVVSTDAEQALGEYLTRNGVTVDSVVSIRPGQLKIPGTPHLLLVGPDGLVRGVWRGKLAAAQEAEVFTELGLVETGSGEAKEQS